MALHFAWEPLRVGQLEVVLHRQTEPGSQELVIHYPHRIHVAPRVKAVIKPLLPRLTQDERLKASVKAACLFAA